ncbi:hypothetical protein, partial [Methanosarcina sp. KYL-1]|uniref:hypothetical protein n=1 Tax=Methanosarcina sp. KYL-1 TaxID=2602068 RepID=UPI00210101C6
MGGAARQAGGGNSYIAWIKKGFRDQTKYSVTTSKKVQDIEELTKRQEDTKREEVTKRVWGKRKQFSHSGSPSQRKETNFLTQRYSIQTLFNSNVIQFKRYSIQTLFNSNVIQFKRYSIQTLFNS